MVEEIELILANDAERPGGQDTYLHVFESSMFFPLQRRREMARMMQIARSINPKIVYEIGADKGGGLYHWCKSLPNVQRVIACEIRGTPYRRAFERAFRHIDFVWVEDSSYDPRTVEHVLRQLGDDRFDILFIDGDKTAFDRDFDSYLPMMSPYGLVFMHDIQDEAPAVGYKKALRLGYEHDEIIDTTESSEALARAAAGIPATCPYEDWLRYWKGRSCGVGVVYLAKKRVGAATTGTQSS
jgi:predicted O-methyltransferase YrrM